MTGDRLRVLSIAAASGKVCCVLLIGNELKDWRISRKASRNRHEAARMARDWIAILEPDVVITEAIIVKTRKGAKTKSLIRAMAKVAEQADLLDIQVPRTREFKNKYQEAASFVEQFPQLSIWKPRQPRIWENEPRSIIYFEALALFETAKDPTMAAPGDSK